MERLKIPKLLINMPESVQLMKHLENKEGHESYELQRRQAVEKIAESWMSNKIINIESILKKYGVPKKYLKVSASHIESRQWEYAINALHSGVGIYLHGEPGTGKTYFSVAMMRDIILKLQPRIVPVSSSEIFKIIKPSMPLFVNVADILVEIRASFRHDNKGLSEAEIIDKYSTVPILFLDDLGVEKATEWSLQTLYTIINRRDGDLRQIIFTSNLNLGQISDRMGDRITSRIAGSCKVIELRGKDRRLQCL